jgi:very-short-patch-repair endonuclease
MAALRAVLESDSRTKGRFVAGCSLEVRSSSRRIQVDLVCQRAALVIDMVDQSDTDIDTHRRRNHRDLLLQLDGWVVLRLLASDALTDPRRVAALVAGAMVTRLGRT